MANMSAGFPSFKLAAQTCRCHGGSAAIAARSDPPLPCSTHNPGPLGLRLIASPNRREAAALARLHNHGPGQHVELLLLHCFKQAANMHVLAGGRSVILSAWSRPGVGLPLLGFVSGSASPLSVLTWNG